MLTRLKNKFKSEDNKRLLSNFVSLSVLQGANFILPLITLPYLVQVLGVEYFGLLAFATAVIAYFNIIVDYGFNLTATREISVHREDKAKIIEIFSSVMTIKLLLIIFSFIIMSIFVLGFEKFAKDWELYFLTFGTVIGQALFPIWFFQGMERMKYITYLNILSKSIFTIAIFVFVQEQNDYYIVPVLTSLGFIVAGIWSLIIIKKEFSVSFHWQSSQKIKYYFLDGWAMFISQFSINLYRNTNIIILGIFTNNTITGYYAIAEKLLKAIQSLQGPIGQSLFPFLSKKYSLMNKKESFALIMKYSPIVFIGYFLLVFFAFLCAECIIELVVGTLNQQVLYNFIIMLLVVVIGGMNYYLGVLGLVALNYKKEFSHAVIITGLTNILVVSLLAYLYQDIGTSISLVISESILLIIILKYIYKLNKKVL